MRRAPEILKYTNEVISENWLDEHIRCGHVITCAAWWSKDERCTFEATRKDSGEKLRCTGNFLWMYQGDYQHSAVRRRSSMGSIARVSLNAARPVRSRHWNSANSRERT